MHKVGTNYPTIKDIFDNYNENIKTRIKTSRKKPKEIMPIQAREKTIIPRQRVKTSLHWKISPRGWTEFPVAANFAKKKGHPMSCCSTYASTQTRQVRCRELNICTMCTRTGHKTKDCLGKRNMLPFKCSLCNSRNHVTPLCDKAEEEKNSALSLNVCTNSRTLNQPFILPMVSFQCPRADRNTTSTVCLIPASRGHTFPRGWRKN